MSAASADAASAEFTSAEFTSAEFASPEFRDAVDRAAQARAAISIMIEDVRSGKATLEEAFVAGDEVDLNGRCFAVKVFEAVPGIGKVRARRTMDELGLDEGLWLRDVPSEARHQVIQTFAQPA